MQNKIDWKNQLIELLVVFIGVTVAFGLNNWQENRRNLELEKKYIESLKTDIDSDAVQLRELVEQLGMNLRSSQELDSLLTARHVKPGEIPKYLEHILAIHRFVPQTITYESLKSSGDMGLIRDFDLRQALSEHYLVYEQLKTVETIKYDFTNRYSIPFFFDHVDLRSAKPLMQNYTNKPRFKNIIRGYLATTIPSLAQYKACLEKCGELTERLEGLK